MARQSSTARRRRTVQGASGAFSGGAVLADAVAMWTYVLRHYEELRAVYGRPPADGGTVAVRGGARG